MGEGRKPKQFLEARPEGRGPRGRPRKSYEDGIEEIGRKKGKSLREMRRLAVDRGRWKDLYLGILGWYKTQNYFTVSTPINNVNLISTTCFDLYKSFSSAFTR
jgi:hypothetical protein